MKPVWLVRSRQIASKMKFWVALVGYNPKEGLWRQSVYLAYVIIFFSLWGFAVLALLASQAAWVLSLFSTLSPVLASTWILTSALVAGALWRGYHAAKTSPFIFSEDDAFIICQTPLDRRQVALAWMLGDWVFDIGSHVALAVVLKFATIQLLDPEGIQWKNLPSYWLAGLRIALMVLLIHLALNFLTYAIGALRLRNDRDKPALGLIPVGFASLLVILTFVNRPGVEILIWPVEYPLMAGLGLGNWLAGTFVALLLALAGLIAIYFSSSRLNLSRAAQESRFRWAFRQVSWLGNSQVSQQMRLHARLGSGHVPSRLASKKGLWIVAWKDAVTASRVFNPGQVWPWMGIMLTGLGMMLPLDWGAQLWAFILWVHLAGRCLTEPLRNDLSHWSITRQLPFRIGALLWVEIARPWVTVTLLSWLAFGISAWAGYTPDLLLLLSLPTAILGISMVAAYDVLRQCHSSELLAGNVPEMGFGGLFFGAIVAAIPLVFVPMIASLSSQIWLRYLVDLLGIGISLSIAYGLWRFSATRYRNIR